MGGLRAAGDYKEVVIAALKEVGPASFFALLVIAVSFIPVLALEAQEGRLFKPLAYTKNLSIIVAAVLAITLDPALRLSFTRLRDFEFRPRWFAKAANAMLVGRIHSEDSHPVSRVLIRAYEPVCRWTLRHKWMVIGTAVRPFPGDCPGVFLPGIGVHAAARTKKRCSTCLRRCRESAIGEAQRALQVTDRLIKEFPEVDRVLGKAGRAETSTDPAPLSMFETVVTLKPQSEWRKRSTWYSSWSPEWLKPLFRRFTPDTISPEQLVDELNAALKMPGLSNAWTMPVKARIDMLSTGMRTPVGLKIHGDDWGRSRRSGLRWRRPWRR